MHWLVLDGVYRCDANGAPSFIEASAPTDNALRALLQIIIARLMKLLTRRGVLVGDMGHVSRRAPGGCRALETGCGWLTRPARSTG
jgi:hypothetical protein